MGVVQHLALGNTAIMGMVGAIAGYVMLALASTSVQEVWLGYWTGRLRIARWRA
jgi:hypothetical protein